MKPRRRNTRSKQKTAQWPGVIILVIVLLILLTGSLFYYNQEAGIPEPPIIIEDNLPPIPVEVATTSEEALEETGTATLPTDEVGTSNTTEEIDDLGDEEGEVVTEEGE